MCYRLQFTPATRTGAQLGQRLLESIGMPFIWKNLSHKLLLRYFGEAKQKILDTSLQRDMEELNNMRQYQYYGMSHHLQTNTKLFLIKFTDVPYSNRSLILYLRLKIDCLHFRRTRFDFITSQSCSYCNKGDANSLIQFLFEFPIHVLSRRVFMKNTYQYPFYKLIDSTHATTLNALASQLCQAITVLFKIIR